MERKVTRKKDGRFCTLEIEIKDGRLSVCGTEGRIVKHAVAKKEALEYWRSYFDEEPGAIQEMNKRCGTRYTSSTGAAKYVISVDGELHGLDVVSSNGQEVLIVESCGQIRDTLLEWFPEVAPLFPWHLNDMKPGCEHQEAAGWDKRPIDPSKPTNAYGKFFPGQQTDSWNMLTWVSRKDHPEGLLSEPCPTCGYKYGTQWLRRELPIEIVKLAETVGA
jgi:hypothetical protein